MADWTSRAHQEEIRRTVLERTGTLEPCHLDEAYTHTSSPTPERGEALSYNYLFNRGGCGIDIPHESADQARTQITTRQSLSHKIRVVRFGIHIACKHFPTGHAFTLVTTTSATASRPAKRLLTRRPTPPTPSLFLVASRRRG